MPRAAHPSYVHVRDAARVRAAVEPLLPVGRGRNPVVHRVLDVALGPGEPQVPQGLHEPGVVGVRQVAHPHLQVETSLATRPGTLVEPMWSTRTARWARPRSTRCTSRRA